MAPGFAANVTRKQGESLVTDRQRAQAALKGSGLLGVNPKVLKSRKVGYATWILHLSPSDLSGYQTCPFATDGCRAACLNSAGRSGTFKRPSGCNVADLIRDRKTNNVQACRIRRTRLYFEDRPAFMAQLYHEIRGKVRASKRLGLTPVFRLNGTSDIRWERVSFTINGRAYANVFEAFPDLTFYDYTKNPFRYKVPAANYSLTFSLAESNLDTALQVLAAGGNVAVVFRANGRKMEPLPASWRGFRVIDADETDLRFLDPKGVVCGLRCKGTALTDTSGFVQEVE